MGSVILSDLHVTTTFSLSFHLQVAVIEGTYLGVEFMSTNKGHRGGDVINIASMGGLVPMSFSPAYCASKHGVVGFTRSMKVVCVCVCACVCASVLACLCVFL